MNPIQNKIISLLRDQGSAVLKYREIGRKIGEKYPQTVKYHIQSLLDSQLIIEKNGFLKLNQSGNKAGNLISVPFYGLANCGSATALAEDIAEGYMNISESFLKNRKLSDFYLIRATGSSMNKAEIGKERQPIDDGDFVLVDNTKRAPQNNDYILSVIDNCANIKKYRRDMNSSQIKLLSESTDEYFPIVLDESDSFYIMGEVIDVIKN